MLITILYLFKIENFTTDQIRIFMSETFIRVFVQKKAYEFASRSALNWLSWIWIRITIRTSQIYFYVLI